MRLMGKKFKENVRNLSLGGNQASESKEYLMSSFQWLQSRHVISQYAISFSCSKISPPYLVLACRFNKKTYGLISIK